MEIWISRRSIQILEYLLEQREYVNIAQTASVLRLSPAQVRYSLDQLEPWLGLKGLELVRKPRRGVHISGSELKKNAVSEEINQINRQQLALSADERIKLLILQLLIASKPLHQEEIGRWLKISRPTLFRDIAYVRAWITHRGLSFVNQRIHGFFVTGREILWREAVLELLLSALDQDVVIARCAESDTMIEETPPGGFLTDPHDFLKVLPLFLAEGLVSAIEGKTSTYLPDDRRLRLILCLGLALYRLALGKTIPREEYGDVPPPSHNIAAASKEIHILIEDWLQNYIPPGEILYIEECIQDGIESGFQPLSESENIKVTLPVSYADVTSDLVRASAQYLHPGLLHDRDFSECLSLVLEQAASERSSGERFETKNVSPMRGENDPLSQFTRRQLAPLLNNHGWKPSENLLDAITVHLDTALERQRYGASLRKVWVVCGAGLATARNLVSRLNMHMPELKILGIASSFEIIHDPGLIRGADAVISTIKLNLDDVLVIHVSPMGTPEDMRRIQRLLGLWKGPQPTRPAGDQSPSGVSLSELLKEETVAIVDEVDSWDEVVELAGGLLEKTGAIWPSYIAAIKDMIVLYGPYMVIAPGVALLHAGPEMGAKRLAVSLVLLQKPVAFGHATFDPVRVAMAFASVDHCSHLQTVGEIMSLMGDETRRERIARSATKGEVIANVLAGSIA